MGARLRAHPRRELGAGRLVALTGGGQDVDRRRSRDAGFDLHLVSRWIGDHCEMISRVIQGGRPRRKPPPSGGVIKLTEHFTLRPNHFSLRSD